MFGPTSDSIRSEHAPGADAGASLAVRRRDGKITDIEVLRGISIIFVVAFHLPGTLITWPIPLWTKIIENYFNTWAGVDLFFAISGFVIGRSLIPKLMSATTTSQFVSYSIIFWVRRAWRLLPSAWLWLAIILLASAVFNTSGAFGLFHDNFESTIAGITSVANIRFGYVFMRFGYGASSPYWSLSLEEQFYLLLPILALLTRQRLTIALAVLLGIYTILPENRYSGVFRLQPIMLGVLLAQFAQHKVYRMVEPTFLAKGRLIRASVLILLLAILASLCPLGERIAPLIRYSMIAVTVIIIVFIASYDRDYILEKGRFKNVMMWFGSRSYALYLTHTPSFCATHEVFFRLYPKGTLFDGAFLWPFLATGLSLSLILAELNYRFVELPLRERGVRITTRMAARYEAMTECAPRQSLAVHQTI